MFGERGGREDGERREREREAELLCRGGALFLLTLHSVTGFGRISVDQNGSVS